MKKSKAIGKRVRARRLELDLSQRAISERCLLHGQVRLAPLQRPQRRKPLLKPFPGQLEQALRLRQILQPMQAKIEQPHALNLLVSD